MNPLSLNWPMVAFAAGFALIAMVPDNLKGPVLFHINEGHTIRLVVAVGIALLLPALIQVNLRVMRIAKGEGLD